MSDAQCGNVREFLPDLVGNRLRVEDRVQVEAHLAECAECRAEFELAQSIYASRAAVPEGLADSVIDGVRRHRRSPGRPWWGLSAAAVAALAIGIGITSEPAGDGGLDASDFAYEVEEGGVWLSDDGLLAGAPTFDGLSDEALLLLLDELSTGSTGGAA